MKLLIVHIPPFSCYFIPLRSKYSPSNPVICITNGKKLKLNKTDINFLDGLMKIHHTVLKLLRETHRDTKTQSANFSVQAV
jgi:hypothetical protein